MYKYEEAFGRLPERFRKPNNEKLYYVLYGYGFDEMEKALEGVEDSRDVRKATGKSLDSLGTNVGQYRQGEDDDLYRKLIQVRIIANLSIGNIPVINQVMSVLVKDVYLGIEEGFILDDWDNEPASIKVMLTKYASLIPFQILDKIKAAGVGVFFEFGYGEKLILKEKTGVYQNRLYPVSTYHQCGSIYKHQYVGRKLNSNINISNNISPRNNRGRYVGEGKVGNR